MTNIFKPIIEAYHNMVNRWKESNKQSHIQELNNSFIIEEHSGRVYILHNGTAIMSFDQNVTTNMVVKNLNMCRKEARTFAEL